ncbi:hypothetical protein OS493_004070 [Desmophyllum pertusum]|uniref:Uncharacterized protein n=1 Tax=Desmophyllum pertusum TaxID=174260 RepID=A0A9W9ZSL9_9CNID|nr:hypothetical protein OS493_004070 [Desmophyllum pertusum]
MQNNERDDDSPDISATQQQQPLVYQPLIPEQECQTELETYRQTPVRPLQISCKGKLTADLFNNPKSMKETIYVVGGLARPPLAETLQERLLVGMSGSALCCWYLSVYFIVSADGIEPDPDKVAGCGKPTSSQECSQDPDDKSHGQVCRAPG